LVIFPLFPHNRFHLTLDVFIDGILSLDYPTPSIIQMQQLISLNTIQTHMKIDSVS